MRDLEVQGKYGVHYITAWIDEVAGRAFCFVDAPSAQAAEAVHREAHGLVASKIIEVDQSLVEAFMGKIWETPLAMDPTSAEAGPALRTILFTDMESSVADTQRRGDAGAMELLRMHNAVIRDALKTHNGSEVKHTGDGIMASFVSASGAVECAIAIQRALAAHNQQSPDHAICVGIGISAGEPVMEDKDLFGAAVQLAKRICDQADAGAVLVANVVRELCIGKKPFLFADRGDVALRGFEDPVRLYEVRWREQG
jgi:class 3 adenylate cyclase